MKPNYPKCLEDTPNDCRFVQGTKTATSMHSPIIYSRTGEPVGGGANQIESGLSCLTCGRNWTSRCTELDLAKGVAPQWKVSR